MNKKCLRKNMKEISEKREEEMDLEKREICNKRVKICVFIFCLRFKNFPRFRSNFEEKEKNFSFFFHFYFFPSVDLTRLF